MTGKKDQNASTENVHQHLASYIVGIRHVGHIVKDLAGSVRSFQRLYGVGDDAVQIVPPYEQEASTRFAFVRVADMEFELIEANTEPFVSLLGASEKGQGGINHVAWTVSDVETAVKHLEKVGILPGHVTPNGVVSFSGRKMVYLDPDTCGGLLVELVEDVL